MPSRHKFYSALLHINCPDCKYKSGLTGLAVGKRYMSAAQSVFLCHTGQMADLKYPTPTDLLPRNKPLLILWVTKAASKQFEEPGKFLSQIMLS